MSRLLTCATGTHPAQGKLTSTENIFLDENGYVAFSPEDPDNPKNWSRARKYWITGLAILLVMNATFSSSAPSAVLQGISQDLDVSFEAAGLVTTCFLLGYVAGPLLWAPLSEFYGRRVIFIITFWSYIACGFLCAFTPNFGGLLAGRFLTATFASAALTNAPGILADIWDTAARGNAMILFVVMTFVGPALGPVVAGFLLLRLTWRWCFYAILWMAGATGVLIFALPETLPGTILQNRARRIRKAKFAGLENVLAPSDATDRRLLSIYRTALTRPWIILFDPISFFVALYYALVYTLLYMLFSIYPIVFQQKRGWNAGVGELPLIGVIIGACLAGLFIFTLNTYLSRKQDANKPSTPEDRLPAAMAGAVLFPVSMYWFAWTAEFDSLHWAVPTVAGTFLASSILIIFVALVNYVVDSYAQFAASALAANTIVRSASAAAGPLFTLYMFDRLGVGGGGSLVGGFAMLCMPIPFVFYRYGAGIRERSKFAQTLVGSY